MSISNDPLEIEIGYGALRLHTLRTVQQLQSCGDAAATVWLVLYPANSTFAELVQDF
jgi:hypothetical protein